MCEELEEYECNLCYEWTVELDNHGGAKGSAYLTGPCISGQEDLLIGIFSMENLHLCESKKKNIKQKQNNN